MVEGKTKPVLLIVEDDLENQKFLKIFLRRQFEIDVCDSAESFYKIINEKNFDIILMDISLKGSKNGIQLTRELRSDPKYSIIPIIVLTAHAFQKDKDNAYAAGVDMFITKPVRGHLLLESLTKALEQKSGIKLD